MNNTSSRARLAAGLLVCAAFCLAACGGKDSAPTPQTAPASAPAQVREMFRVELGPIRQTLASLPPDLRAGLAPEALSRALARDLGPAAKAIDLDASAEVLALYADDAGGFYVLSLGLSSPEDFRKNFPTSGPKVDPQGHQLALRPLPGSSFSPLDRPLFFDIRGQRLLITDLPRGLGNALLGNGLSSPGIRASVDAALLWERLGAPLESDYEGEKKRREMLQDPKAPKIPERVPWTAFFLLGKSLSRVSLEASGEPLHVTLKITPNVKLPKLTPVQGVAEVMPESQFGYHLQVPVIAAQVFASIRDRFAPPALDLLGFLYPISRAMSGPAWVGGGVGDGGLWVAASYGIQNPGTARALLTSAFSRQVASDGFQLEQGRRFTFKEAAEKTKEGEPIDLITASKEGPLDPVSEILGLGALEIRALATKDRLYLVAGKNGAARLAMLRNSSREPQELPAALAKVLPKEKLGIGWFSSRGFDEGIVAPIDTALSFSQEENSLRFDFVYQEAGAEVPASAPASAPAPR